MAVPSLGATSINPQSPDDIAISTSGGTLDGSNVVQLNYNDASFTGSEGKTRLILAVEHILDKLQEPDVTWPIS